MPGAVVSLGGLLTVEDMCIVVLGCLWMVEQIGFKVGRLRLVDRFDLEVSTDISKFVDCGKLHEPAKGVNIIQHVL